MTKSALALAMGLTIVAAQAQAQNTREVPEYRDPFESLVFMDEENEYQFERSSLRALNVQDPIEGLNRRIYRFNAQFDEYVYLPAVRGYIYVTPHFVREGVSNFFANLADVPNLANSVAQGKIQKSMRTTARLLLNTTLGVGGLIDVAERAGLPQEPEDLGQTLGRWGVPPGPYLVVPFLGPSSLRDGTGRLGDWGLQGEVNFLNHRSYMNRNPWTYGVQAVDLRLNTPFRYGALDSPFEYDQVRYLYTKLRELQIEQ